MTEVPPDVKAAIERIAAMPDTVKRARETIPVASSIFLRPAGARALLAALDSQKQSDVSPDGNGLSDMTGPYPDISPFGEIGRDGSPLAYLIDPGAGSGSDRVTRFWPTRGVLDNIFERGGSVTPLYSAHPKASSDGLADALADALERASGSLGNIQIDRMGGDNLAITLCSYFDDPDEEQDENGWSENAINGYKETIAAIAKHYTDALAAALAAHGKGAA